MVAPRRRRLVLDLGSGKTRGGAGARLLSCRRHRTRDRLRYRLCRRCDIVYVADDAEIGYPPVRLMSPPDMQYHPWLVGMRRAMELMLTGDAMSGREAAEWGFATRSFPLEELDARTLDFAERAAKVPVGIAAAQQALGAPRDGDHGRACRDARRHGNPGAGLHDGGEQELHVDVPPRRIEREIATRSARHGVRGLPDEEDLIAHSCHAPLKAGIQYAAASRSITGVSGILDRPVEPGDDTGI